MILFEDDQIAQLCNVLQNSNGLQGCEDSAWFILGTYFEQTLKPELQRYSDTFMESDSGLIPSINFLSNFMQGQYKLNNTASTTSLISPAVKNSQVGTMLAMVNKNTASQAVINA